MNRLVIIGNGFDIAHGLKTSYMNFIDWYWEQTFLKLRVCNESHYRDSLLSLSIVKSANESSWMNVFYFHSELEQQPWKDVLQYFRTRYLSIKIEYSPLFERIMHGYETKGWVDIENDYYTLLKNSLVIPGHELKVKELNNQLAYLQDKLVEYLCSIEVKEDRPDLRDAIVNYFNPADFSTEGRKKAVESIGLDIADFEEVRYKFEERDKLIPKSIMLLSFNYTGTARMYNNFNLHHNYIHGELTHPENIIFGYGDELDKDYQDILDKNDNELLRNVKSVKYLETCHYREMLQFIESAPFQVLIMGHSCGNSDRTLLNTVFEHENCISIKPYYHKWDDGTDNYLDIVQNISRNFTDMKLFRDRVVNKEQCQTM